MDTTENGLPIDEHGEVEFQHEADGMPTSEPCPGSESCDDCQDVLAAG